MADMGLATVQATGDVRLQDVRPMRILITGNAGFIGSHVADALVNLGHTVYGMDNLLTGSLRNVNDNVIFSQGDITKSEDVNTCIRKSKPDVVIHAAASYNDPTMWMRDENTNSMGTLRLLSALSISKCMKFIYFQTSLCYGPPKTTPITLGHPINPKNSYAISKTAGEMYIRMSGIPYYSFRLANCYGPRNLSGPVPTFFKRLTEGELCTVVNTRRDFVYVDDLVRYVIMAVGDEQIPIGCYHVSTGTDISIHDLYKKVCENLGVMVPCEVRERSDNDVKSILLDPTETDMAFGFLPETTLEDGLGRAVEWYKEHGVEQTFTHLGRI